jgi:hypothetical protein
MNAEQFRLLRSIVSRRLPEMLGVAEELQSRPLLSSEREALQDALVSEFVELGLDSNFEPTKHGREIDDLIGLLNRY